MVDKLQDFINELKESKEVKNSREKSLTITKLEEAMFWLTYATDKEEEQYGSKTNASQFK